MRQEGANLLHYYVEKQVFSWRNRKQTVYKMHYYVSKQVFFYDAPNTLIFDALLRVKAGFLRMRQKSANLLPYYVEKQVFSWRTKNSYIWCIITWKSRFSHDVPKRCKFVAMLRRKAGFLMMRQNLMFYALLRGKAGFLMMRQKSANLLPYYVEKQVFS